MLYYPMLRMSRPRYAPVAQLDRVSDSDSEGRAFESHRAYQKPPLNKPFRGGFLSVLLRRFAENAQFFRKALDFIFLLVHLVKALHGQFGKPSASRDAKQLHAVFGQKVME